MRMVAAAWAGIGWLLFGLSNVANAAPTPVIPMDPPKDSGVNVIFITVDGVRWQELFHGPDGLLANGDSAPIFPYLFKTLVPEGFLFGNKDKGDPMYVANPTNVSLPGYQSMMGGVTQPCSGNGCGQIGVETFPERLVRQLGVRREQIATFASWKKIAQAVEHAPGATVSNAGMNDFTDPAGSDAELVSLNANQRRESPPWSDARFDKYTWAQAMRYLKLRHPRFLWISFDDSDEYGHRDEYANLLKVLRQYDGWLGDLDQTLRGMGDYGKNTALVITTDHGRGSGFDWTDHNSGLPDSRFIWLYGRAPGKMPDGIKIPSLGTKGQPYSHVDIRPTIETLFGLTPQSCNGCGRIMSEMFVH